MTKAKQSSFLLAVLLIYCCEHWFFHVFILCFFSGLSLFAIPRTFPYCYIIFEDRTRGERQMECTEGSYVKYILIICSRRKPVDLLYMKLLPRNRFFVYSIMKLNDGVNCSNVFRVIDEVIHYCRLKDVS